MNLEWLLSPVTQYILVGLGLVGSLVLWISFMRELHSVRTNAAESSKRVDETVKDLTATVEQVRESLNGKQRSEAAPALTPAFAAALPATVTNPNKRAQALLLHLGGEPTESISAVLATPRNEIELMLKLSRLLQGEHAVMN